MSYLMQLKHVEARMIKELSWHAAECIQDGLICIHYLKYAGVGVETLSTLCENEELPEFLSVDGPLAR